MSIATKTGTVYPQSQYVIGAHYDSVNNPGADDDASGVAAVFEEIARILAQYETAYTIKFCTSDAKSRAKSVQLHTWPIIPAKTSRRWFNWT